MLRYFTILTLLLISFVSLSAQSSEERKIQAQIELMFNQMRNLDKTGFSSHFIDTARLTNFSYSLLNIKSKTVRLQDFVRQFDQFKSGDLDERIEDPIVHIDDFYAVAWVPYTFYFQGKLSHCGVNNFTLLRSGNQWKITSIVDTRRENCNEYSGPDEEINNLLDKWHHAAAVADADTYFGMMRPGGVFIGTDPSERWTVDEFQRDVASAFQRESAWDFTAYDRQLDYSDSGDVVWFDELLDTWMGICRGSGVVEKVDGRWVIKHYQLSVTVYNDDIQEFLKMAPKKEDSSKIRIH